VAGCTSCGAENREGAKFCGECGAPLALVCAACGAANEQGQRFCNECGTALAPDNAPVAAPPGAEAAPLVAERRFVSVLFADLVGFTSKSERLDPEDVQQQPPGLGVGRVGGDRPPEDPFGLRGVSPAQGGAGGPQTARAAGARRGAERLPGAQPRGRLIGPPGRLGLGTRPRRRRSSGPRARPRAGTACPS